MDEVEQERAAARGQELIALSREIAEAMTEGVMARQDEADPSVQLRNLTPEQAADVVRARLVPLVHALMHEVASIGGVNIVMRMEYACNEKGEAAVEGDPLVFLQAPVAFVGNPASQAMHTAFQTACSPDPRADIQRHQGLILRALELDGAIAWTSPEAKVQAMASRPHLAVGMGQVDALIAARRQMAALQAFTPKVEDT